MKMQVILVVLCVLSVRVVSGAGMSFCVCEWLKLINSFTLDFITEYYLYLYKSLNVFLHCRLVLPVPSILQWHMQR